MKISYFSFIFSFVSLTVIGGIFTYRLINSFLENILLPCLDITILPDDFFSNMNVLLDENKKIVKLTNVNKTNIKYSLKIGLFLKEVILWFVVISMLYLLVPKNNYNF